MRRLWVRLSLLISGLLLAGIFSTALLVFLIDPDRPGDQSEVDDGPTAAEIPLGLAAVVTFVTTISVIAGVVVSRSISAPITRLATAAQRIGGGDLETRVQVGGSRELVALAQAFNTMAGDLQRAEEQRANLMADVSHELRTPLTALEGNLRAALDRVYDLDDAEIADLYGQTQHLIRLVNDLRELALAEARQLPLRRQQTDLSALVNETVRVFAPLADEQGVHLAQQIERLPAIRVDAARIRQVLHNLLANALRHTPAGGSVTVVGRPDHDEVYLAVVDTGAGLEANQVGLVFDRFYRTDRSRSRDTGGAGLGLAIVKAIVEAHDGRVVATSNGVGQGSSFGLYLPQS
jgi:signal transduction histidine kinase